LIFKSSSFTLGTNFPIDPYIPVSITKTEIQGVDSVDDLNDIYSDEGNLG
jgi:hypothetical protein